MLITFSSCFYVIPSKFGHNTYIEWMNNLISIVNHFNLVIYTDEPSSQYIDTKNNPKIRVIIKPMETFYNYRYKEYWIKNHEKNVLLNKMSCWQLNMLWAEKINFVKLTVENKYFDTDFYGWIDIGYFRNRHNDIHTKNLSNWGQNYSIIKNNIDKICYACINNDTSYMNSLYHYINNRNSNGLPSQQIPPNQYSIAGGCFFLHKKHIIWWFNKYDKKLIKYFENDYLVKDDQIILVDCIFKNMDKFAIFRENIETFDNWFMFQRLLN